MAVTARVFGPAAQSLLRGEFGDVSAAVLAAPVQSAASTATTGGTLAGTFYYKIVAVNAAGTSLGSNEVVITATGTSTVTVNWAAVTGATGYRIYRGTAPGAQDTYYEVGNVLTFTDTGAAGTAGTVPTTAAGVRLKALLVGAAPSQDLRYSSELTGEVIDASYTPGGVELTNVLVTYDTLTNTMKLDCDDVTFPNLTALVGGVVFYRDTGTPATSPLLMDWVVSPAEQSTTAPYVLTIAPEGLLRQVVV